MESCGEFIKNFEEAPDQIKKSMFVDLLEAGFLSCFTAIRNLTSQELLQLIDNVFFEKNDDVSFNNWYNFWKKRNNTILLLYPIYCIGIACIEYIILISQSGENNPQIKYIN